MLYAHWRGRGLRIPIWCGPYNAPCVVLGTCYGCLFPAQERISVCRLLGAKPLPWYGSPANFARVVRSAKSCSGAYHDPAHCRGCTVIKEWPSFCGYWSEPRELASLGVKDAHIDGCMVADQLPTLVDGRPLYQRRHKCGHLRRTGAPFAIVCRGCYPNGALGSLLRAESNSTSLQLCCHMRKSHSVVVITLRARLCNWSLIVKTREIVPVPSG